MKTLFTPLQKAFAGMRKRPALVALAILVDVLFLVSFGFVYGLLFAETADHLDALNTILAEQTAQFVSTQDATTLTANPDIDLHYAGVVRGIGLILLVLYILWSLSQGVNWWVAHTLEERTVPFMRFIMRSFIVNLAWVAVFVAILFAIAWLSQQSLLAPVPLIGP
ncbi:MAG: hypothetical protein AABY13_06170, partial [Nanoarchaeota archaeon]